MLHCSSDRNLNQCSNQPVYTSCKERRFTSFEQPDPSEERHTIQFNNLPVKKKGHLLTTTNSLSVYIRRHCLSPSPPRHISLCRDDQDISLKNILRTAYYFWKEFPVVDKGAVTVISAPFQNMQGSHGWWWAPTTKHRGGPRETTRLVAGATEQILFSFGTARDAVDNVTSSSHAVYVDTIKQKGKKKEQG